MCKKIGVIKNAGFRQMQDLAIFADSDFSAVFILDKCLGDSAVTGLYWSFDVFLNGFRISELWLSADDYVDG